MNRQVLNVYKSVLFKIIFSFLYTFLSEFYCKISFVKYNYVILFSKNTSGYFMAFICCNQITVPNKAEDQNGGNRVGDCIRLYTGIKQRPAYRQAAYSVA